MRIVNSVSAGYSSVMMSIMMPEWYPNAEIVNIMANTGKEREESLIFMNECDKYYGLNLVWVEADINPLPKKGTRHVVKKFDTLTRDGSLFEAGIKKYGIPNVANKWCNRELKLNPIHSYVRRELGWGRFGDYYTAIGIRVNEIDRIPSKENRDKFKILLPLFENKVDDRVRNKFWSQQPIKLNIGDYEGNCDHCFEKTNRKHCTIHSDYPEKIDWWDEMEKKYSSIKIDGKPDYNNRIIKDGGNYFLRDNKPISTIKILCRQPFSRATNNYVYENDLFDLGGGCDQNCNIFESVFENKLK